MFVTGNFWGPRNDYLLEAKDLLFLCLESPYLKMCTGHVKQTSGMFVAAGTFFKCSLANLGVPHSKSVVAFGDLKKYVSRVFPPSYLNLILCFSYTDEKKT